MKRQRGRGRSNNNNNNNNQGGRSHQNPNRSYESNGPDVKLRGSATHIYEKYLQYARDRQSAGDRVAAENYLQHAEHYYRILAQFQPVQQQRALAAYGQDGEDDYDDAEDGVLEVRELNPNADADADGEDGDGRGDDDRSGMQSRRERPQGDGYRERGPQNGQVRQDQRPRERDNRDRDNRDRDNRDRQDRDPRDRDRDNRDREPRPPRDNRRGPEVRPPEQRPQEPRRLPEPIEAEGVDPVEADAPEFVEAAEREGARRPARRRRFAEGERRSFDRMADAGEEPRADRDDGPDDGFPAPATEPQSRRPRPNDGERSGLERALGLMPRTERPRPAPPVQADGPGEI